MFLLKFKYSDFHHENSGAFKQTSGMSDLKIGDPLDGSFSDNNNRAYGIGINQRYIFASAYNPNQQSKLFK